MNSPHTIINPDPRAWDAFVSAHDGHLLQTSAWGELKSRFGWSAQRIAVKVNDAIVSGAQLVFRRLPLGLTLAYVPRGPVADPSDRDTFPALFEALCAAARKQGAFALKIEPNWEAPLPSPLPSPLKGEGVQPSPLPSPLKGEGAQPSHLPSPLEGEGVRPSPPASIISSPWEGKGVQPGTCIQPHTTIHVDLTRNPDTILAEMKPKWRYNIRLAERKGITVREGTGSDLPRFYELLKITSARDQFPIHTFDYYHTAFELLTARDYARLFVAEYAGEPIAAVFISVCASEAIYLYGASGNEHRDLMPNHALHWHAMQWAKARGCTHYDLWGVGATAEATVGANGPRSQKRSGGDGAPLPRGLYQFKQGFGGRVVEYAGAYDVVFSRWKFALYQRALAMRRGAMG